jgi:hypothetical protein
MKQFNNEANGKTITGYKSNEKEQFPEFFILVDAYNTNNLSLTSGIAK